MKINVNCNNCKNLYLLDKNHYQYDISLNKNFICCDCYDIKKNNSINSTLFKNIDRVEKAYIVGLLLNNVVNNELNKLHLCVNNISRKYDIYIIKLLKLLSNDVDYKYYSKKNTFKFNFEIYDTNIIKDLVYYFNNINNFFINLNNDYKYGFIRGFYEGICDDTNISNCKIYYNKNNVNNTELIYNIMNFLKIPYTIDNDFIIFNNHCNYIDFLGKIYNNAGDLCINHFKFNFLYSKCKVFKADINAVIPSKANESDVGFDLTIIKKEKEFNKKTTLYDTGIKIELTSGHYAEIVPRSSLSKSGYILSNSVGIIDNSYRGNLYISLTKIDDESPDLTLPFKCCQLIIRKQTNIELYEVEEDFNSTKRNEGGFGSTTST